MMNATNSLNNVTVSFCLDFYTFIVNQLMVYYSFVSFFLNVASTAIFVKLIQMQPADLYKYLMTKSLVDTLFSLIFALYTLITPKLDVWGINTNFYMMLVYYVVNYYLSFVLQLISVFCDIAASFNRYRKSINKLQVFDKCSCKIVISLIFVYSFGFYSYRFVSIRLVFNDSETIYELQSNGLNDLMGYMHSFVRDGVCVLIIIVLNVLTVIEIRKMFAKKKLLTKYSRSERVQSAEARLSLMIFTVSTLAVIGHGLILAVYLNVIPAFEQEFGCFQAVATLLYTLSYEFNFFFYILFNLNFRKIVKDFFLKIFAVFMFQQPNRSSSTSSRRTTFFS